MLKIAWSEVYRHPLPENHRFPMIKYDLIPEQLLYEGSISESNLFAPDPLDEKIILATHDFHYLKSLRELSLSRSEERKTGFPLSKSLVDREVTIANGTLQTALFALRYGASMNVAGGTHHSFEDRGEGFCLLNDIAISANYLLDQKLVNNVMIVDLDVHQGNGTASIFQYEPKVFTFSMHGKHNYPLHKEVSDLDIALEDFTNDNTYLSILAKSLEKLGQEFEPEFVFYQSGVDVLGSDKLGRLSLSINGCKQRDQIVVEFCKRNDIPLAVSMGGGYSRKLADIIEAHANTFRVVQNEFF